MVEQPQLTERWSGESITRSKWGRLSSQVRSVQGPFSQMFREQGDRMAGEVRVLGDEATEARLRSAITLGLRRTETLKSAERSAERLAAGIESALDSGARAALAEAGVDLRFDLSRSLLAGDYLHSRRNAMEQFNQTTRARMDEILRLSVEEKLTPREIAARIRLQYREWSLSRAEMIATTEVSAAFEAGRAIVLEELNAGSGYLGVTIERRWVTMGDDRVTAGCRANEAQGWQPVGTAFQSGHDHPPRHPRCRCATKSRVIKF